MFHIKLPFRGDFGPRDFLSISITIDMNWIKKGPPLITNCLLMAFQNDSICLSDPVKATPGDSSTYEPYDPYGL